MGTVRARLCRARGILRDRLIRRGIAVPAGLLTLGLTSEAPAAALAIPAALSNATVAAAGRAAAGAAVSYSRASLLARGALQSMSLHKLGLVAALLISAALAGGTAMIADAPSGAGDERPPAAVARTEQSPAPVSSIVVTRIAPMDDPVGEALFNNLPLAVASVDPYHFTFALIRLAKARNTSGDRNGALAAFKLADQVAATVEDQHLRRLALMRTAVARGRIGDKEPARATLENFAHEAARLGPEPRYSLMSMVIDFLHQAGFQDEAAAHLKDELAIVEAIPDERIRDGGIHRLLYSQVALGDYDGALRQAERYTGQRSHHRASLIQCACATAAWVPTRRFRGRPWSGRSSWCAR